MYYCEDCGNVFEDYEIEQEFHSEVDTRRYEEIHVCPNCGSDEIVTMKRCPICNNDYVGDGDICDECKDIALEMWQGFKEELQDVLGCDYKMREEVIRILVEDEE